jgi:hypothetical protein
MAMSEPEHALVPPAVEAHPKTDAAYDEPEAASPVTSRPVREIGGPAGPEPTRFGDWEKAGRCIDF